MPFPLARPAHGLIEMETHLNEKADKADKNGKGFIVVYPLAEVHQNDKNYVGMLGAKYHFSYISWNSPGAGMNVTYGDYDDLNYLRSMTQLIDGKMPNRPQLLNTDPNARYLLGFSEGGEFAPQIAANMPGYWAGIGILHGTSLGTERMPAKDPMAYVQITGELDNMLPREGGGGMFGWLYPRLSTSHPTAEFDRMAQAEGCQGTPRVDKSDPKKAVTTFSAEQCDSHRPVIDVDIYADHHAADGHGGNLVAYVMGTYTGLRHSYIDSTDILLDTLLDPNNRKNK